MASALSGRRVAFLATDGVEQSELQEPWKALEGQGVELHLVSLKSGEIQAMKHDEKGDRFPVTTTIDTAKATDYAGLVLPGGVKNPDVLRMNEKAVQFVRDFFDADKPVAAICHGPWLLVEADVVRGRTLTSWPSLRTDIRNAGGEWVDKAVQVDQKLVTSRKPDDLPLFCAKLTAMFAESVSEGAVDRASEASFPASDPPPGPVAASGATRGKKESEARA